MTLKRSDTSLLAIFLAIAMLWAIAQNLTPASLSVKIWRPLTTHTAHLLISTVELNAASYEDLLALPGIGPVLAQRILDYRQAHGPFGRIEELVRVNGIGPKLLEKLRPYLVIQPRQ
jgi:comEA protein